MNHLNYIFIIYTPFLLILIENCINSEINKNLKNQNNKKKRINNTTKNNAFHLSKTSTKTTNSYKKQSDQN